MGRRKSCFRVLLVVVGLLHFDEVGLRVALSPRIGRLNVRAFCGTAISLRFRWVRDVAEVVEGR